MQERAHPISLRFRGFLPVVVDVETGGFNCETDALLEIAAVLLDRDEAGRWTRRETLSCHVEPFPGANIEAKALEFNRIIPDHPLRAAKPERRGAETRVRADPVAAPGNRLYPRGCWSATTRPSTSPS